MAGYYDSKSLLQARGSTTPQIDTRGINQSIGMLSDTVAGMQKRKQQEAARQDLLAQRAIENERANALLSLKEQEAKDTAAYREAQQAIQGQQISNRYLQDQALLDWKDKEYKAQRGDEAYRRNLEKGQILGAMIQPEEMEIVPDTSEKFDKEKALEYIESKPMQGPYMPSREELEKIYQKEVLGANYDERTGGILQGDPVENAKRQLTRVPTFLGQYAKPVDRFLFGESQAQKDSEKVPTTKPTLTKEEFLSTYAANPNADKASKEEFTKALLKDENLQREQGILGVDPTATAPVAKTKTALLSEVKANIEQYAKDNKLKPNSPTILGMKKTATEKVEGILKDRKTLQMTQLKALLDTQKLDRVQRDKLAAIKYKIDAGKELSDKDQLEMMKIKSQIDLNKEKLLQLKDD